LNVNYQVEPGLSVEEFISVLQRSTLAQRRPVDQPHRIQSMIQNADVLITARVEGLLVGVARGITDFSYCTYLSDLAVDADYQRKGIGRELIRRVHEKAGLETTLILLSAPAAVDYYPHIGMRRHESCWIQ
jgi:predicted N-acetyltransferase YhbS